MSAPECGISNWEIGASKIAIAVTIRLDQAAQYQGN